jgi:hypothetical protein
MSSNQHKQLKSKTLMHVHFVPPRSNFFSTAAPRQADQQLRTQIVLLEEKLYWGKTALHTHFLNSSILNSCVKHKASKYLFQ